MAAWTRAAPRAKGLILGAASVAAVLAVGVWASSVAGGVSGLLQGERIAGAARAEAAAAVAQAVAAGPSQGATGVPVSPAEAERVYASTGVWLRAPGLPDLPRADGVVPAVALATGAPGAGRPAGDAPEGLAVAVADTGPVAPALPLPSGSRPLARGGTGPDDASGDVLVVAGPPAVVPPSRPESVAPIPDLAAAEPPGRPALRPEASGRPATMQAAEALPASASGLPQELTAQALALLAAPPGALSFADPTAGAADLTPLSVVRPPARPGGLAPGAPSEASVVLAGFDGPRPGLRPDGLAPAPTAEPPAEAVAAAPDPATDPAAVAAALAAAQQAAAPPPAPAPPDVQAALASIVAGAPDPLAGATRQAVAAASRPDARPRTFGSVVSAQLGRAARAQDAAVAAAAPRSGAPEDVEASDPEVASAAAPSGPTPRSVAQAATFADVMALREVNLIGVFGQPGARRALVRTGNGRYLRVGVGDSLDGGRVTAIGDNALNYSKRGRQMQLVIPGA